MARYTSAVVVETIEEMSEEVTKKLKIYGIDKVAINDKEITVVGKGHPQLWKTITLEKGEVIDDFEGIDDETKKIGHTFPIEKCNGLLAEAFGYEGKIVVLENQVLYLRDGSLKDDVNETISELVEGAVEMIDVNDEPGAIIETAFDTFQRICQTIGNKNLAHEIGSKMIDMM